MYKNMGFIHICIAGVVIFIAFMGLVSTHYLGDQNPIELAAEDVIEMETGLKVDLDTHTKHLIDLDRYD
jgi:hypothetical protein